MDLTWYRIWREEDDESGETRSDERKGAEDLTRICQELARFVNLTTRKGQRLRHLESIAWPRV